VRAYRSAGIAASPPDGDDREALFKFYLNRSAAAPFSLVGDGAAR
jgi:hypothetical protein